MVDLTFIKDLFDDVIDGKCDGIDPIDRNELYENGAIYYENGNDGTDFDYQCNNKTCEFYVYLKNGDGYIKCNQRRDELQMFVYNRYSPFDGTHKEIVRPSKYDLKTICAHLMENFDNKGRYDEPIESWKLYRADYSIAECLEEDW